MEEHRVLSIMDIYDVYGLERETHNTDSDIGVINGLINELSEPKKYKFNILEFESDINKLFDRFFYIYNNQKKIFDIIYNRDSIKTLEVDFICVKCYNSKNLECSCEGTNIDIVQIKFNSPFNTKFNILFNESKFEFSENFETSIVSMDINDIMNREDSDVLRNQFRKLLRLFFDFTEIDTVEENKIKLIPTNKYLSDRIFKISDKEFNFNYVDKYMINLF